jgi:hypothetical protein
MELGDVRLKYSNETRGSVASNTMTAVVTRNLNEDIVFSYAYNPTVAGQEPIMATGYCLFPLRIPMGRFLLP